MRTISLELRGRILAACDKEKDTRQKVADRFRVSLGMVKKLLAQRQQIGDIGPLHHRSGRKPIIGPSEQRHIRTLRAKKPNLNLRELRDALKLDCSLPAIHFVLKKMGLTKKKKPPGRKSIPTSRKRPRRDSGK